MLGKLKGENPLGVQRVAKAASNTRDYQCGSRKKKLINTGTGSQRKGTESARTLGDRTKKKARKEGGTKKLEGPRERKRKCRKG